MRDLGFREDWPDDSVEQRLVDMTIEAGYGFVKDDSFIDDIIYECVDAGIRFHKRDDR